MTALKVRVLLAAIAAAKLPCLSIMNVPPLPFLERIDGIDITGCRSGYADAGAWDPLDSALVTHCSADAQVARVAGGTRNTIRVCLPTNSRAGRFASDAATAMLRCIGTSIDDARLPTPGGTACVARAPEGARLAVRAALEVADAAARRAYP
ncbi:MAG: hypothetical protein L0H73_07335 [Nitrococcus sp.]|nr:hypothetical protein [Nitrococcus sp.]